MNHHIGVIGLGIMGQRMLGSLALHPRFVTMGAFDPSPAAMAWLAEDHPAIEPVASAAALARRDDLVALYIASPPTTHPAYVELAWDCGKVAFCEKPLAVSIAAAEKLCRRADAERRDAAINFPFATSIAASRLLEEVRNAELGDIRHIDIAVNFKTWPRPWQQAGRWLAERGEGGFVREVVSHFLFLALRIGGPLKLVSAKPSYPADGIAAETAITASLTAGTVPVTLTGGVGTTEADDRNSLTVTGSLGSLRIEDWMGLSRLVDGGWQPEDLGATGPALRQRNALRQLDDLAALIEGKPHHLATLAEGLAVQVAVEGMLKGS